MMQNSNSAGLFLPMWVVYFNPLDFMGLYVAREFDLDMPTERLLISSTLEGIRAQLPPCQYRMDRSPLDERQIIESWF